MVETNRPYRYDGAKDEYIVAGVNKGYVFTRRLKDDGSKSRFYTTDFAVVTTVKENLRMYTTREVKQMGKVEQLMPRLGTRDECRNHRPHQLRDVKLPRLRL